VIVGGGLTTAEMAHQRVVAGAKVIVTGNFWERCHDISKIREFANAVHTK
jgi:heptaprenylglyceryl phosphate synthase